MCVGELMNSARHSMWRSHRGAPSLGFLCARGKTGTYCIFVACCESPKKKKKKKRYCQDLGIPLRCEGTTDHHLPVLACFVLQLLSFISCHRKKWHRETKEWV